MQVDRTGSFRFKITDCGVGVTKNKFPQWVAALVATQYYDDETEQWIDFSEYNMETMAYAVLFSGDGKPTLTAKQLQKALGWSGASFEELGFEQIGDVEIQCRVEEREYQGKTSLQVTWIDHYDAEPGRSIRKLDVSEVKKLEATYAAKLRALSGGPKPQTVESPKSAAPKVDKEAAKAAAKAKLEKQATKTAEAEKKAPENRGKKKNEVVPSKSPKAPAKKAATKSEKEIIDMGAAWIDVCKVEAEDEARQDAWYQAIDELGGDDAVNDNQDWAKVRNKAIEILS